MIEERMIKTHLVVTGMHEEYRFNWCGKIANTKPMFKNDKLIFVIIGTDARAELNTLNMKDVEECAKRMAVPRGRASITSAKSYIYIKEEDDNEVLLGIVTHDHIKEYAQMYDKIGYKV